MRRVLVVVVAAVLGAGLWSATAVASPAPAPVDTASTEVVVDVGPEAAPVCPAEQIVAAAAAPAPAGSTVVSFTLVDPRCES